MTCEHPKEKFDRSSTIGFGSAIAIGVAFWILSGVLVTTPDTAPTDSSIPAITIAPEEARTVNVIFSLASVREDGPSTLLLTESIVLAGFAGQREITWMMGLKKGKNLLPLPLIAISPADGELLATLSPGEDDRTFRLRIDVV